MRAAKSFGLLLVALSSTRDASNAAPARPERGPRIEQLTISPEQPAPGEEVTATVVIRDERGVRGFRVSAGELTKDVPCGGRKTCTRTLTKVVPKVSSPSVTITIIAENTQGQRTRIERELRFRLEPGANAPGASSPPAASGPPAASRPSEPGGGDVFFRSGFEEGVTLKAPERGEGGWVQYLAGADQGYDWSRALPQRPGSPDRISYLVSGRDPQQFAVSRIEPVTGHDGKSTRALYMEVKKEDPSTKQGTRVQYGIYPNEDLKQAYVRYWVKLQPDLASAVLPPGTKKARQFMEAKETGAPRADFRWEIFIRRDPRIAELFWATRAQFGDLQKSPVAWECTSKVPVPVGEWFMLEVFWKLGVNDGRMWGAANGRVFVDYKGRTQKDSGLFVWWPFKVYVGTGLEKFREQPIYQWIDDVEFARKPPTPLPDVPKGDTYTCHNG
jgi:hypothetical protein